MASQTRTKAPKRAVYRKRHKALQHLTEDTTHHGFGHRIVQGEPKADTGGIFGLISGASSDKFQKVNSRNYRQIATSKEPRHRQTPLPQNGTHISNHFPGSQYRGSSSPSPTPQIRGHCCPGKLQYQEPGCNRDEGRSTDIHMSDADLACYSQYLQNPHYSISNPIGSVNPGAAEYRAAGWNLSQFGMLSSYSDDSKVTWQEYDPLRFGQASSAALTYPDYDSNASGLVDPDSGTDQDLVSFDLQYSIDVGQACSAAQVPAFHDPGLACMSLDGSLQTFDSLVEPRGFNPYGTYDMQDNKDLSGLSLRASREYTAYSDPSSGYLVTNYV